MQIEFVDSEMATVLAKKSEADRLRIAWGMWRSSRRMLTQMLAAQNESWTADEVEAEVNRRMAHGT